MVVASIFSDPSRLGYNTTQMAYGGFLKMQTAGNADNPIDLSTMPAFNVGVGRRNSFIPNMIPPISFDQVENEEKNIKKH